MRLKRALLSVTMGVIVIAIAIFIVMASNPGALAVPDEAAGRIVSVISADSMGIEMLVGDQRTRDVDSVKLADIVAPSTVTPEGKAAQKAAVLLLKNQTVYIDIDENSPGGRNEWGQLICVIYLIDSQYRPMWPPVNRILVDEGHAQLQENGDNEFNSSVWWQEPISQGTKGNILIYKEKMQTRQKRLKAQMLLQKQHSGYGEQCRAGQHRLSKVSWRTGKLFIELKQINCQLRG